MTNRDFLHLQLCIVLLIVSFLKKTRLSNLSSLNKGEILLENPQKFTQKSKLNGMTHRCTSDCLQNEK